MLLYIVLTFLLVSYIFYTKFVKVFIFEESDILTDVVLNKKAMQYPSYNHSQEFYPNHYSYESYFYFIELQNQKELIPVNLRRFIQIMPKQNVDLVKKTRYYMKRSGWLWKNSDLLIEEDIKLKEY